jgi:hypothetical protein
MAREATVAAEGARASAQDDAVAGEAASAAQGVAGEAQALALSLQRETRTLEDVVRGFLREVQAA